MIGGKRHIGIGFATGRKSFLNVLRAYIFHLSGSNFLVKNNMLLSLFVAYDPHTTTPVEKIMIICLRMKRAFFTSAILLARRISKARSLLCLKTIRFSRRRAISALEMATLCREISSNIERLRNRLIFSFCWTMMSIHLL